MWRNYFMYRQDSIHIFSLAVAVLKFFNDNHMCFTEFSTKIHWNARLAASDICLHNQLISFNSIIVQISEKCDSSNRQEKGMVASFSNFNGKFELVFVLTFKNTFSKYFHFKANRKSINFSENGTRDFQNIPLHERSACFYLTISKSFKWF